jgi:ABC-type antimicrobial peptide transport system permease subunit
LSGSNPIGKTLRTVQEPHYPSAVYEIVGVIGDTKYNDLRSKTPPMTFAPAAQFPDPGPWTVMMIHSSRDPALAISTLKRKIAENHPEIVTVSADFQTWIRDGLVRERLMAMLSGFFGLLAVLLAVVGLYGVASYMMARRRNEIGIRMALGARSGQVLGMVMREASQLVAIGILIGMALSLLAGRAASSLLFGLKPYDPLTLAAAAVLLAAIASLATLQPARRAAKLDPMIALRNE